MTTYHVSSYRYAKGKFAVHIASSDGFKTAGHIAAERLNLRYVHRARGYIASAAQVRRFQAAMKDGEA